LRDAQWRCGRCGSKRDIEVHHTTYERLGKEWDSDLEVLCVNCHRGEHLENPDQTSLGVYLKLASAAVRATPFASIADLSDDIKTQCAKLKIKVVPDRIHAAIAVVCGNRLKTQPPQNCEEIRAADFRPLTKDEARDFMCRLEMHGLIKSIQSTRSKIDIYAEIREPQTDYDLY
jgi:hypothetical protein